MCETFYGGLILSPYLYTLISLLISSVTWFVFTEWLYPKLAAYLRGPLPVSTENAKTTTTPTSSKSTDNTDNKLSNRLLVDEPKTFQNPVLPIHFEEARKSFLKTLPMSEYEIEEELQTIKDVQFAKRVHSSLQFIVFVGGGAAWFVDEWKVSGFGNFASYTSFYGFMINGPLGTLALSVVSLFFHFHVASTLDVRQQLKLPKKDQLEVNALVLYQPSVSSSEDKEKKIPDEERLSGMVYAVIEAWNTESSSEKSQPEALPKTGDGSKTATLRLDDGTIRSGVKPEELYYPSVAVELYVVRKAREGFDDYSYLIPVFCFFFLLPPFLTHILPALGAYLWFFLPLLCILYLGGHHAFSFMEYNERVRQLVGLPMKRTLQLYVIQFFVLVVIQVSFNFGSLLYFQTSYMGVFAEEFLLRTQFYCFLDNKFSNARQIWTFFSW
jgi:hypothetical protein